MTNFYGQQDGGSASSDFNSMLFVFKRLLSKIRTLALVTVISCTNSGGISPVGMVNVQILVNQMTGGRTPVAHGPIYNVPYCRIQGGANAMIIDPQAGDIGMCGFCSRDISAIKKVVASFAGALGMGAKAVSNPGSYRSFDWADGLYFGGCLNGTPTTYLQFDGIGNIKAVTPSGVVDLNGTTIDASGNVVIKSGSTITDGQGIVEETHVHGDVTSGGSDTGPPA